MTNTVQTVEPVLKTDVSGRVLTPVARRERLLDEFERSGLSGAKFAALVGIKYQTFATWAQRRREQRGVGVAAKTPVKPADQMRWLEAVVEQAESSGGHGPLGLMLQLPGGARLELANLKQVALAAALLRALEKPTASC
jgi:hypothetical protein